MMVVEEDILLMNLELIGNNEVILRVNANRTTVARMRTNDHDYVEFAISCLLDEVRNGS